MPLPGWVDHTWVRWGTIGLALVIPLIIGVVSLLLLDPEDRPRGLGALLLAAVTGYPYTLGTVLGLVHMTLFAPLLKLEHLVRR